MAQRRMFSMHIIDSDAFLDMPQSTQNLYFHMSMRADDDGFVSNPKKIMKILGSSDDDLKLLIGKRFIIGFESGIVVIKHWKIHNYIAKDRYNKTRYEEELNQLQIKDNGSYTECIQSVDTGKVRLVKVSQVKESKECISDKSDKDIHLETSFNKLWDIEQNKESKARALKNYKKALKLIPHDTILNRWQLYYDNALIKYSDKKYITRLANWLGEKAGYLDDPETIKQYTLSEIMKERENYRIIKGHIAPDNWAPPAGWDDYVNDNQSVIDQYWKVYNDNQERMRREGI